MFVQKRVLDITSVEFPEKMHAQKGKKKRSRIISATHSLHEVLRSDTTVGEEAMEADELLVSFLPAEK